MRIITILFFTASIFIGCTNAQTTQVTPLSATATQQKIEQGSAIQIVDVRTPEEFKKGHIKNAMNLNINGSEFENQLATLDKSKPVLVYCLSGGRSSNAVAQMKEKGFTEIYEMPGGMMEWRSNNLPEEKPTTTSEGMSRQQYDALLQTDKMVLVDFYADWCAPCKKMKPYLEKISEDMKDKVVVVRINADDNAALCKELNLSSLPVLKLYKNNKLTWENKGFIEEEKVRKQLQ